MYWMEVAPSISATQASSPSAAMARRTRPASASVPSAVTTPTVSPGREQPPGVGREVQGDSSRPIAAEVQIAVDAAVADGGHSHRGDRTLRVAGGAMTGSRRSFLKMWAAAPALGLAPRARALERSSFDPWVEVRPDHLRHNVGADPPPGGRASDPGRHQEQRIRPGRGRRRAGHRERSRPSPASRSSSCTRRRRCATPACASPSSAWGRSARATSTDAVALDIQPMVYTPVGAALERIAARRGRPVSIHVCVDTGIGRVGVPYREAAPLLRDLGQRRGVHDRGHHDDLHRGSGLRPRAAAPLPGAVRRAQGRRRLLGRRHAASSFALFQTEDSSSTWCGRAWRSTASTPSLRSGPWA